MSNINQEVQASHKILTLLEKANSQTEAIIDNLPGMFIVLNTKFEVLRANLEALHELGDTSELGLRTSLSDLFSTEIFGISKNNVALLEKSENRLARFELNVSNKKDDNERPFYWRLSHLADNNNAEGGLFTLLGEDISELRDTES